MGLPALYGGEITCPTPPGERDR